MLKDVYLWEGTNGWYARLQAVKGTAPRAKFTLLSGPWQARDVAAGEAEKLYDGLTDEMTSRLSAALMREGRSEYVALGEGIDGGCARLAFRVRLL